MKNFKKHWLPKLIFTLLIIVMGFVGYFLYYLPKDLQKESLMANTVTTILSSVYSTLRLFTMSYDVSQNTKIEGVCLILLQVARFGAILITGTALGRLILPLLKEPQNIYHFQKWKRNGKMGDKRFLLVGYNDENMQLLNSIEAKEKRNNVKVDYKCLVVGEYNGTDNIKAVNEDPVRLIRESIESIFSHPQNEISIIINTKDEETNFCLCHEAVKELLEQLEPIITEKDDHGETREKEHFEYDEGEKKKLVSILDRVRIVVFSGIEYENTYLELRRKSYGTLRYINKARLNAINYVLEHPLTEQMLGNRQYLPGNGLIAKQVRINVFLIGFGHANQQIYAVSSAVNQFISGDDPAIPQSHIAHYYAFDSRDKESFYNLDDTCLRYSRMKKQMDGSEDYLPLPIPPAELEYIPCEIGSAFFYDRIREIVMQSKDTVNYAVIAIGSDLQNIELAQHLAFKKEEYNLPNFVIHCKVRDHRIIESTQNLHHTDFVQILDDKNGVLNMDELLNSKLLKIAKLRNRTYIAESSQSGTADDIDTEADFNWYTMDPNKQDSNLFDVLSLRFKLNLIGMDYRIRGTTKPEEAVDEDEYWSIYAKKSKKDVEPQIDSLIERKAFLLSAHAKENIPRNILTVEEHYRWNAYMIFQGFVPATKSQINAGKIKDYKMRYHANLTTFEGLFDFRKLRAENLNKTEIETDVIKYDFQIMDKAWQSLNDAGYEIYKVTAIPHN